MKANFQASAKTLCSILENEKCRIVMFHPIHKKRMEITHSRPTMTGKTEIAFTFITKEKKAKQTIYVNPNEVIDIEFFLNKKS